MNYIYIYIKSVSFLVREVNLMSVLPRVFLKGRLMEVTISCTSLY